MFSSGNSLSILRKFIAFLLLLFFECVSATHLYMLAVRTHIWCSCQKTHLCTVGKTAEGNHMDIASVCHQFLNSTVDFTCRNIRCSCIVFKMEKENYCFQHNIQFENSLLFTQHNLKCSQSLERANVCTQFANDGTMCGKFFVQTKELCQHAEESHGVFLCEICDYQTNHSQRMSAHHHSRGTKGNIHHGNNTSDSTVSSIRSKVYSL